MIFKMEFNLRDAFSTACFVLGLEKALELAKNK